jgi:hypothetical protein
MSKAFNLRLPPGLQDKLVKEAVKANRSLNGEIVHRLTESLKKPAESLKISKQANLNREDVITAVSTFLREWKKES